MWISPGAGRTGLMFSTLYILLAMAGTDVHAGQPLLLNLEEAEQLALVQDPVTQGLQAEAVALAEQAIGDGQLPDPQLKLGIANLPVDSFSRSREGMTMLEFGLQQAFPPGRTLHYRRERGMALSDAEHARSEARKLEIQREVRLQYLDLYYRDQVLQLLQENQAVFERLVEITERRYAAGRDNQQEIMRAELELTLLEDRILENRQAREADYAALGRYISAEHVGRPLPETLPVLPEMMSLADLEVAVVRHPLLLIEDAGITAATMQVQEAEQMYRPGFMVDVTYGQRSGREMQGGSRPDMLSAMVSIDLPIFTSQRQDRRLAAAQSRRQVAQFSRTDRWRELDSAARRAHADWQRLGERLQLYEQRALVDARMGTEASLKAYQNDQAEFTTVMRARLNELDTQLTLLRLQVDQVKVQARLLYLQGES